MFDPIFATVLFVALVAAYTWFTFTDFCNKLFTLPGRILVGAVLFAAAAVYLPRANAAEVPSTETAQKIVRAQLLAFENKDDSTVFSMMSADTQKVTKTPKDFHMWVETNMPALLDQDSVLFGDPWVEKESMMQPVIVFSVGKAYAFVFVVSRCADVVCIDNIVLLPIKLFGV